MHVSVAQRPSSVESFKIFWKFNPRHKYPGGTIITDLRRLEKASIKARKAELDLNFLRNCRTFNVFPKFLCFQLPNVARQDVISIRKHLLKSAITKRNKEYRRLLLARDKLSTQIRDVFGSIDFYILQKAINRNVHQTEAKVIETLTRKLEKLTRNAVLPFTANETVTNISSCCLTSEQLDVLKSA